MGGGGGGFFSDPANAALTGLSFTPFAPLAIPALAYKSAVMDPQKRAAQQMGDQMKAASINQAAASAELERNLASQPRATSPDNFLAMKSKALSAMRLGLSGTITGANAQPLGNGALKSKLGQ